MRNGACNCVLGIQSLPQCFHISHVFPTQLSLERSNTWFVSASEVKTHINEPLYLPASLQTVGYLAKKAIARSVVRDSRRFQIFFCLLVRIKFDIFSYGFLNLYIRTLHILWFLSFEAMSDSVSQRKLGYFLKETMILSKSQQSCFLLKWMFTWRIHSCPLFLYGWVFLAFLFLVAGRKIVEMSQICLWSNCLFIRTAYIHIKDLLLEQNKETAVLI